MLALEGENTHIIPFCNQFNPTSRAVHFVTVFTYEKATLHANTLICTYVKMNSLSSLLVIIA